MTQAEAIKTKDVPAQIDVSRPSSSMAVDTSIALCSGRTLLLPLLHPPTLKPRLPNFSNRSAPSTVLWMLSKRAP